MRRLLIALVGLLLLLNTALADITLITPYADTENERALSNYLAAFAQDTLRENVKIVHEVTTAKAVNAFLALPQEEKSFLVCTPEALILSLQRYTEGELLKEATPVGCIAASESRFYASPAVAELLPNATAETLTAYADEHPYELFAARLLDAGHTDFLTVKATEDMYVDENLYMDYTEAGEAAQMGEMDFFITSTAMQPEEIAAYLPLCPSDLPGVWQGVFVRNQAPEDFVSALSDMLTAMKATPEFSEMAQAYGYIAKPAATREAFAAEVAELSKAYLQYLTNEGLFFY